jgi:hypothetical protein
LISWPGAFGAGGVPHLGRSVRFGPALGPGNLATVLRTSFPTASSQSPGPLVPPGPADATPAGIVTPAMTKATPAATVLSLLMCSCVPSSQELPNGNDTRKSTDLQGARTRNCRSALVTSPNAGCATVTAPRPAPSVSSARLARPRAARGVQGPHPGPGPGTPLGSMAIDRRRFSTSSGIGSSGTGLTVGERMFALCKGPVLASQSADSPRDVRKAPARANAHQRRKGRSDGVSEHRRRSRNPCDLYTFKRILFSGRRT